MSFKVETEKAQSIIHTRAGIAHYFGTEIEDKQGRWNQDYNVKEGFWVIHEGAKHHIYKVKA